MKFLLVYYINIYATIGGIESGFRVLEEIKTHVPIVLIYLFLQASTSSLLSRRRHHTDHKDDNDV